MSRFRKADRTFRGAVFAAMACGALLILGTAASSFGATATTPYRVVATESPDPGFNSRFAERLTDAADLTGDGIRDVFASSWVQDVPTSEAPGIPANNNAGRIALMNGATQQVVYKLTPEPQGPGTNETGAENGGNFGFYISVPGDLGANRDGKEDLVSGASGYDVGTGCGTPEPNGCNENQGRGYVISGPNGQLITTLNNFNPQPSGGFASRIGAAGDVGRQGGGPKDGVPDILVAAPSNDFPAGCGIAPDGRPYGATGGTPISEFPVNCRANEGEVFVVDGRTFGLIRTLTIPPEDRRGPPCGAGAPVGGHESGANACGGLGGGPQVIGDLNRDGTDDHLVPAPSYDPDPTRDGRIYIFSGANGAVLARIDQPQADANAFFGLQDLDRYAPGDLNADGYPELYGTGFVQEGPNGEVSAGRAWVFDGRRTLQTGTGQLLFDVRDPFLADSRAFGWADSRTDYNKDGRTDLYISNLQSRNTNTSVFDGRDGSLLRTLHMPSAEAQAPQPGNNGSSLGWSSRAPGDLNRDCEPDYVAAAPYQDVGVSQDQGKVFWFLSNGPSTCPRPRPATRRSPQSSAFPECPAGTANVIRGSAAGNTITGSAAGDRVFAGSGDDVVDALAGDDCVDLGTGGDRGKGGPGDDLMLGALGNDRISGNAGDDRLRGGASKDRMSGGSGNDSITGNSGNDRLNGSSGRDRISGGSGSDRISARDGRRDRISCGSGRDTVSADRIDRVSRSCERIRRR